MKRLEELATAVLAPWNIPDVPENGRSVADLEAGMTTKQAGTAAVCKHCGEEVYEHGTGEILSVGRKDEDGADSAVCPDGYLHEIAGGSR